ncbi:MAG: hypothetical protein HY028_10135 [Gammaproteobacteria bacterium]|nr:hypothetical protein [Gammaproteobacteria bacterium]
MNTGTRIVIAGLAGGLVGNGVLGVIFTSPPVHALLYDPALQSALFIELTPQRNIPLSVAGLVVLSIVHAWLFQILQPSIPGKNWVGKGMFWGGVIWVMYWLFQEWFIYHTLLGEPWLLNFLELAILLIGSTVEGLIIAYILGRSSSAQKSEVLSAP